MKYYLLLMHHLSKKTLLDYAEQLIEIVKSTRKYSDDTVLTLNILQIQKRKRKLLSKEKL